jgi:hypothetical protein
VLLLLKPETLLLLFIGSLNDIAILSEIVKGWNNIPFFEDFSFIWLF